MLSDQLLTCFFGGINFKGAAFGLCIDCLQKAKWFHSSFYPIIQGTPQQRPKKGALNVKGSPIEPKLIACPAFTCIRHKSGCVLYTMASLLHR